MNVRARRAVAALPLALAVLWTSAGCGGSGPGDEEQITELARGVVTAPLGDAVCRTQFSEDFVLAVYGDLATCASAGAADQPGDNATGVTVTGISIQGDTATAKVTKEGGAAAGAGGTWAFTRAGDGWRVAEWRMDYLRADFKAQFGGAYRTTGPDDPFANVTVRSCVSEKFQALADAEFRSTAYAIFRKSDGGDETLRGWYYDCIAKSGKGISTLRRIFEDGLRQAKQIPPGVVDCVVLKLRETVTDKEIRTLGESGAAKTPPAIQKRIRKATVSCVNDPGAA